MKEKTIKLNKEKILSEGIPLEEVKRASKWTEADKEEMQAEVDYLLVLSELREYKKKTGLSNAELAKRTGISRPEITNIFHGKRNVTIHTLTKLARAFNSVLKVQLSPA